MFGFKFGRTKELEEQLRIREQQLEEFRSILREANDLQDAERNYFLKVTEERAQLAKGLAKVATESKNRKDLDLRSVEETEEMEEAITALASEGDSAPDPEELASIRRDCEAMTDFFREMSVLALTAAIEGQRSGESAARFVSIAEQIKGLADEKGRTMEDVAERIGNLCAGREEAALSDTDAQLNELLNRAKRLKNRQMQLLQSETECLGQLDKMGDRFLEDQKSAEEAEFYFRQVVREEV